MLADAGHSVTGVDISAEMVRIAQLQVPQATFIQADAANLTFAPTSFHAITAFFSLLMLRRSTIESTLQQLKTLLKTSGYLVLSMVEGDYDYREIHFLGQSVHVSAYPREFIVRHLQNLSFTVLDSPVVQFQVNEQTPPETQLFFFCTVGSENLDHL
jgi:ubiquinone/menaquinone biosynthesis C-methylase UbiE